MGKRKVIFYADPSKDEFSRAVIVPRRIDENYVYDREGPLRKPVRFFWYRAVATPLAFLYVKLFLRQKTEGKETLAPYRKTGIYLYGNHTQAVGDPLTPNVFAFPKNVSFIVHPANVSMPVLGKLTPTLGAIPLPGTIGAYRAFSACLKGRIEKGHAVVVYPEAHIWPYYTGIRPFPDASFAYPVKDGAPVFCFVNTYRAGRFFKRPKMITRIDGPFLPDPSLSPREAASALREKVYTRMCALASVSDVEFIRYVRSGGEADRQGEKT